MKCLQSRTEERGGNFVEWLLEQRPRRIKVSLDICYPVTVDITLSIQRLPALCKHIIDKSSPPPPSCVRLFLADSYSWNRCCCKYPCLAGWNIISFVEHSGCSSYHWTCTCAGIYYSFVHIKMRFLNDSINTHTGMDFDAPFSSS